MSSCNGRLLTCNRCGKTTFLKHIGTGETDGGWTHWDKFEPAAGWDMISGLGDVCPDCKAEYNKVFEEYRNGCRREEK